MRAPVVVESQEDFDAWLAQAPGRRSPAEGPPRPVGAEPESAAGQALFAKQGCSGCHTLAAGATETSAQPRRGAAAGPRDPAVDRRPGPARPVRGSCRQLGESSPKLEALVDLAEPERRRGEPVRRGAQRIGAERGSGTEEPGSPAFLGALIGGAFGFGLVVALRAISGLEIFQTEADRLPARDRARDHGPARLPDRARLLRLLVPLGRRALRPSPTTTPSTAPTAGSDYFKFNTDHKVIGIQYIVTSFIFFFVGGADRDGDARRARPAGHPDRRPERLQRALLDPRRADDLRLRDPGLRRDRELRPAADDRGAGHGVPAPQRAQLLAAADRRGAVPRQLLRPRAAPSTPAGPATRRSRPARRWASRSSTSASSSRARRRSRPRSTSLSRSSRCVRRG